MGGYRFYDDYVRPFICASQLCYVERSCYEHWCALGLVLNYKHAYAFSIHCTLQ